MSGAARADDEEEARAAMRRGVAAFGRGEAEAALGEYETAKRLAPRANAPYRYAAEALLSLGRYEQAVQNLEAYLAKSPGVSDASEVKEKIAKIKAEHYPAKLRVKTETPDATVRVDDEPKGPPGTIELPPGKHRVEVRAPGHLAATQDVTLVGEQEKEVVFTLEPQPPERPPAEPPPYRMPVEPPESRSPWRTVGWIGVGVGAATIVTSAVLDVAVLGPKIGDYRAAADREDVRARDLHDEASSLRTGVLVGYVAGAVVAAGGAALVVLAPSSSRTARVVPAFAPGHAGVVGSVSF
jgi:tetratricopeptide (TPR) repeat protein